MEKSTFVYVTFIRTTPEKLWDKLTETGVQREFFFASVMTSELKVGSAWKQEAPDGTLLDSGKVLEVDPPKRLVLSWRNHYKAEMKEEVEARMTYEIEPKDGGMVKLTVLHESDVAQSKLIKGVSNGWPIILSSLKTLLETGEALEDTRTWD